MLGPDGHFAGDEVVINEYSVGGQLEPAVAALPGGDFIVVWAGIYQDGDNLGVVARRVARDLGFAGAEFVVNSYTTGIQRRPVVAAAGDGRFLVAWDTLFGQDGSDRGLFGQLFAADGERLGVEFQVNSSTQGRQYNLAAAGVARRPHGVRADVLGRLFGPGLTPRTGEFQVNGYTVGYQEHPNVVGAGGATSWWLGLTTSPAATRIWWLSVCAT